MEDTLQYNFSVKSNIHDYEVYFIGDVKSTLAKELKEGDFIIIFNIQFPTKLDKEIINKLKDLL